MTDKMAVGASATIKDNDDGCTFIVGCADGNSPEFCRAPRRPGSAYCAEHHARCRLPPDGTGEHRRLREIEALALAAGGRLGRAARSPPPGVLRRFARLEKVFLRPDRSPLVLEKPRMAKRPTPAVRDRIAGEAPVIPANTGISHDGGHAAGPSVERRRHGPVERLEQTIADSKGQPSRPYRAVDTLQLMERRGSITPGMRQAGEDFRARFAIAQLDPLHAIDLRNLRIAEVGPRPERETSAGLRVETARRSVWVAIQAVGGIASPAGSCLWHVLGWERSLKEWAVGQGWAGRRVSQEAASGILVAALGALETHFRIPVRLSPPHFSLDKSGWCCPS